MLKYNMLKYNMSEYNISEYNITEYNITELPIDVVRLILMNLGVRDILAYECSNVSLSGLIDWRDYFLFHIDGDCHHYYKDTLVDKKFIMTDGIDLLKCDEEFSHRQYYKWWFTIKSWNVDEIYRNGTNCNHDFIRFTNTNTRITIDFNSASEWLREEFDYGVIIPPNILNFVRSHWNPSENITVVGETFSPIGADRKVYEPHKPFHIVAKEIILKHKISKIKVFVNMTPIIKLI